jgi:hypothetical protein
MGAFEWNPQLSIQSEQTSIVAFSSVSPAGITALPRRPRFSAIEQVELTSLYKAHRTINSAFSSIRPLELNRSGA